MKRYTIESTAIPAKLYSQFDEDTETYIRNEIYKFGNVEICVPDEPGRFVIVKDTEKNTDHFLGILREWKNDDYESENEN